jgi:hypothetical protein
MKHLIFAACCLIASSTAIAHDMHGAAHEHAPYFLVGIISAMIAACLAEMFGLLK